MDVSNEIFKGVSEHHHGIFAYISQAWGVARAWAQGLGANKWLTEGCEVNVSRPCCLYRCLRSTPLFRYRTFLFMDLASSPRGLHRSASSWGLSQPSWP